MNLHPSLLACALAAGLLAGSGLAQAEAVAITNAGFETQPVPPGAFIVNLPAGWQAWDPTGRLDGNADALGLIRPLPGSDFFPAGVPEGNNAALVFLSGPEGGEAGLQQTLATPLVANMHYTLTVAVGNIASGTSLPGSSDGGGVFYNLNGFPGYRIELLAGNTVLASDNNTLAGQIGEVQWRDASFSYTSGDGDAALGQPLRIRLINLALPGTVAAPGIEVDFDHVRLDASPVPEPATALLWLAGLAALAARSSRTTGTRSDD